MRLTPFTKRALVGVATGGVLAAGLLVPIAYAAEAVCPTFTDPAGDESAPGEKDIDLVAVTYTVVEGRFQTILKLTALGEGPVLGTGDIFRTTFTVAGKAGSFGVDRTVRPSSAITPTGTLGGKPVTTTAVFSTKDSTVTLSAAVADLETAAGSALAGQAFSAMKASTSTVSGAANVPTITDSAAAPAAATYAFGDVCGGAPTATEEPSEEEGEEGEEPTDDPSATPTGTPTGSPTATDAPTSTVGVGGFVAMPVPVRVLDTRATSRVGAVDGPVTGEVPVDLSGQITGSATAAVLNVTSVGSTGPGYVVVHREGTPDPGTSSLNWAKGQVQANEVTVALDDTKQLVANVHSNGTTELVVDLIGYITADPSVSVAGTLQLRTPKRLFDHAIPEGGTRIAVPASDRPAGTTGVLVNLTLVTPRISAFLSAYPGDQERPMASTVNATTKETQSNETLIALDSDGTFIIDLSVGSARAIVDLLGTYGAKTATSGTIVPLETPKRVLDTRRAITASPAGKRAGGSSTALSLGALPANTVGVVLQVTTSQATAGYVIVHAGGTSRPGTSTMSLTSRNDRAHQVMVGIGTGSPLVSVVGGGASTHLIVDLVGYIVIPSAAGAGPSGSPSATGGATDEPTDEETDEPTDEETDEPTDEATPTASPSAAPSPTKAPCATNPVCP